MEIRKFTVGDYDYEFVCESGNTRNGFYHKASLFKSNKDSSWKIAESKVNYLNRTWESYRYQTAMSNALYDYSNERYERLLKDFKNSRGYAKMTQKRYDEFHNCEEYKNDSIIKACAELKERVRNGK